MQQGVQYIVTLNDPSVISAFGRMESSADRFERSISGINTSLASLGIYLGAREIIEFGKNWIQGAADYETAMLRIKNVSDNDAIGIKNQLFINNEVDQFKVKLDETAEAYGKFLFKIKNAHITSDAKNTLFHEILGVSKVAGLTMEDMSGTIYQTAALLGEGVMVGRNLRQLAMIHPNLMPYIADELGIKDKQRSKFSDAIFHKNPDQAKDDFALQQLSQSISHGLTQQGISSIDVMTNAWSKYFATIKDKLPETLTLLQSSINELDTEYQRLRNTFVMDLKPEVMGLFQTLEDGVHFIKDHEAAIISLGKSLIHIGEFYIAYKAAVALGIIETGVQTTAFASQTGAAAALNAELVLMNINLETLIALQADAAAGMAAMGGIGLAGAAGGALSAKAAMGAFDLPIAVGLGAASGSKALIGNAILPVAVMWMAASVIDSLNPRSDAAREEYKNKLENDNRLSGDYSRDRYILDKEVRDRQNNATPTMDLVDVLAGNWTATKKNPYFPNLPDQTTSTDSKNDTKFVPEKDKITGQRVITYNVTINGGINGQKIEKQIIDKGGDIDMDTIMNNVARGLESIMNDSQMHGNE